VDCFAAAWLLYYVAAHIMDKVEDHDRLEGKWLEWGPRDSINIASGLYFTASLLLTDLYSADKSSGIGKGEINRGSLPGFLRMCSSQHAT
jgi:hypothetical protein